MNAPLPNAVPGPAPLPADVEQSIRAAAALIRGGANPDEVAKFIYSMGYMNGTLDMAQVNTKAIVDAAMRSAL